MAEERQSIFNIVSEDEIVKTKQANTRGRKSYNPYDINVHFLCWLQQFGLGGTAGKQLASVLQVGDASNVFHNITSFEEQIGLYQIALSKMIIEDNVYEEMTMSPVDAQG